MFIPEDFPNLIQQEARLERALAAFRPAEQERIRAAFDFAKRAHEGQVRQGPSHLPYIIHPIRVACSLVDEFKEKDANAFIAALLHDVVEDTGATLEEIEQKFGPVVRRYVTALTWQKGGETKWHCACEMLGQPRIVRLVKASDVIDNSRATWEVSNRADLLKWIYGYAHWGRRIVESVGEPATIFLEAALQKTTTLHFGNDPEPPLLPNLGKSLNIALEIRNWKLGIPLRAAARVRRYPIHTAVITPQDNLEEIIRQCAAPYLRPGDILAISERIVAITQGRAFPIKDIQPSRWAKFLVRFVHKSPYGIGLGSSWTMELAIREAGLPRLIFAAVIAAVTKPLGFRGMFYRVAGKNINAIDGPCSYTLPPYNQYAKLGPKDPDGVAEKLARKIGIDVAIIDANDLGVTVLGASTGVNRKLIKAAFRDNPLGQTDEQTPMAIVRLLTSDLRPPN